MFRNISYNSNCTFNKIQIEFIKIRHAALTESRKYLPLGKIVFLKLSQNKNILLFTVVTRTRTTKTILNTVKLFIHDVCVCTHAYTGFPRSTCLFKHSIRNPAQSLETHKHNHMLSLAHKAFFLHYDAVLYQSTEAILAETLEDNILAHS